MSEMVERVARKLAQRCGVDPDDMNGGTWDGGSYSRGKPAWMAWENDAREAITVMREPSKSIDAMSWSEGFSADIWRNMIDEALS